jgi:hypothetical protein
MNISLNLNAIDWNSVSLLESGHLTDERTYIEELIRGALSFRGHSGAVRLEKNDLLLSQPPNSAQASKLTLKLKNCLAISPKGYAVYIASEPNSETGPMCMVDSNMPSAVIPVYLNVEEEKENSGNFPRMGTQARFLQWRYTLSIENPGRTALDALQVGRIIRPDAGRPLQIDSDYIAPSARLDGNWLMKQKVQEIQKAAYTCWDLLKKMLDKNRLDVAPFAPSLGQAAVLMDWQAAPLAYLERMTGILRAHFALHILLPDSREKRSLYQALMTALNYIEPNLEKLGEDLIDWGVVLTSILKTFELLSLVLSILESDQTIISTPKIDLKKMQPK